MDMIYVDSSSIEQIGYDEGSQEIHVVFLKGGHYVYSQVSEHIFENLKNSDSIGTFVNSVLKAGGYPVRKL